MTRIELAPEVLDDFDRFFDHLAQFEGLDIPQRLAEITQAIEILGHSPLIGRPVTSGKRELLIGRGSRAYVALYRYVVDIDTVFVLALRSQREVGFKRRIRVAARVSLRQLQSGEIAATDAVVIPIRNASAPRATT